MKVLKIILVLIIGLAIILGTITLVKDGKFEEPKAYVFYSIFILVEVFLIRSLYRNHYREPFKKLFKKSIKQKELEIEKELEIKRKELEI
jgi:hypothetical protein